MGRLLRKVRRARTGAAAPGDDGARRKEQLQQADLTRDGRSAEEREFAFGWTDERAGAVCEFAKDVAWQGDEEEVSVSSCENDREFAGTQNDGTEIDREIGFNQVAERVGKTGIEFTVEQYRYTERGYARSAVYFVAS